MMMRVKLVIIRISDGSTVSRLIRMRTWRLSDSGRPSPEIVVSARSSAPGCPPADWAHAGDANSNATPSRPRRMRKRRPPLPPMTSLTVNDFRCVSLGQKLDPAARHADEQSLVGELHHDQPSDLAESHRLHALNRPFQ